MAKKEKLKWGCRVKPTKRAVRRQVVKVDERGIFLGYYRNWPHSVVIVKEGQRTPQPYFYDFWEKV